MEWLTPCPFLLLFYLQNLKLLSTSKQWINYISDIFFHWSKQNLLENQTSQKGIFEFNLGKYTRCLSVFLKQKKQVDKVMVTASHKELRKSLVFEYAQFCIQFLLSLDTGVQMLRFIFSNTSFK